MSHFAEWRVIPRQPPIPISASKCGFRRQRAGMRNCWLSAIPGLSAGSPAARWQASSRTDMLPTSTDTGHTDDGYDWANGHPEKLVDWGHRAVHETAVAAKQLIQSYYGKPPRYAYWNSCHNGGNQGLNEAQRYPRTSTVS